MGVLAGGGDGVKFSKKIGKRRTRSDGGHRCVRESLEGESCGLVSSGCDPGTKLELVLILVLLKGTD